MTFAYSPQRTLEIIQDAEGAVRDAVGDLVDALIDANAIRIHREWPAFAERKQIVEIATKLAIISVLTCDWAVIDDETRWLHCGAEATQ